MLTKELLKNMLTDPSYGCTSYEYDNDVYICPIRHAQKDYWQVGGIRGLTQLDSSLVPYAKLDEAIDRFFAMKRSHDTGKRSDYSQYNKK